MSGKEFGIATLKALPALMTVLILLVGIYTGVCTPTEAGALASAYAILISTLIYRTMGPNIPQIIMFIPNHVR